MSEKLSRKDLKSPDKFQEVGVKAETWISERQNLVLGVVIGAFVVAVIIAGMSHLRGNRIAAAAWTLGDALKLLERPVDTAPSAAPSDSATPPPFKSQQEKDEAIIAAAEKVRAEYGSTPAARTAALAAGHAQLRLGKHQEALSSFEAFLASAEPKDPLRAAALEGIGYAHETKGDLELALTAYDRLAREAPAGDFLKGMGLYHRGRVLIAQGKKEEAAKQLAEVSAAAPDSAAARSAKELLASLAAEGIKPPAASATGSAVDGGAS